MSLILQSGRYPGGEWQLNPVFLPGESHTQRCLAATVHRTAKSWTQLSNCAHTEEEEKSLTY